MDHHTSGNNYMEAPTLFSSHVGPATLDKTATDNPTCLDNLTDPLCKLNLKETSEFVKSLPVPTNTNSHGVVAARKNLYTPTTPGRPVFSFSTGSYSRKSFPSKWDDAEKWLVSGSSCNDSPSGNNHHHNTLLRPLKHSRMLLSSGYKPHLAEVFADKSRVTAEEKVPKLILARAISLSASSAADVVLKEELWILRIVINSRMRGIRCVPNADKFPNEENPMCPNYGYSVPMQQRFLFGNSVNKSTNNGNVHEVKHRDIGTEMTPLSSCTTSRCPTPFKSMSPVRHNTPANRSGPLVLTSSDSSSTIDITQLQQECHLAKLNFGTQFDSVTSNWSSREEEEEDISKSLRHFEMDSECRKSVSESRYCAWEEEEKTKGCLRYQREEAKIQAWVNLQSAKAEAESRKLEVKIQKMRSNLEEKLMKRMADVHRRAEEWRASAQFEHSEQIRKVGQQARKVMNKNSSHFSGYKTCGCFPCNNHHI